MAYPITGNENIVTWQYMEHPSRWIIACLLFIQVLFVSALNFSDFIKTSTPTGEPIQDVPALLLNSIVLLFLMVTFIIFLQPRVPGYFRVNEGRFEYNSGRRAINVLAYVLDFISHFKKPSDIFSHNLFLRMELIPRRVLLSGAVSEISALKLEAGSLGTKISFLHQDKTLIVINDLSEEDTVRIYEIMKSIIGRTPTAALP